MAASYNSNCCPEGSADQVKFVLNDQGGRREPIEAEEGAAPLGPGELRELVHGA